MEEIQLEKLKHLYRLSDEMATFRLYLKIYFAGVLTTFVLGTIPTLIVLFIYLFYEFNIYEGLLRQIPADLRMKYKSKILLLVKWIDRITSEALEEQIQQ